MILTSNYLYGFPLDKCQAKITYWKQETVNKTVFSQDLMTSS